MADEYYWSDPSKIKNPYSRLHELYASFPSSLLKPVKFANLFFIFCAFPEAQRRWKHGNPWCETNINSCVLFLVNLLKFEKYCCSNFGAATFFIQIFCYMEHPKGAIKICANLTRCWQIFGSAQQLSNHHFFCPSRSCVYRNTTFSSLILSTPIIIISSSKQGDQQQQRTRKQYQHQLCFEHGTERKRVLTEREREREGKRRRRRKSSLDHDEDETWRWISLWCLCGDDLNHHHIPPTPPPGDRRRGECLHRQTDELSG